MRRFADTSPYRIFRGLVSGLGCHEAPCCGNAAGGNPVIVEARNLHKTYHQMEKPVHAVRGINLQVEPGDYIAIAGPSGCGKSTLLHLLGALDTPTEGEVIWQERIHSRLE